MPGKLESTQSESLSRDESDILRPLLTILTILLVGCSGYLQYLFDQGKYSLVRFQSVAEAPKRLDETLARELPSLKAGLHDDYSEGVDGSQSYEANVQYTIMVAMTGLVKNGIINELIYLDEWNRKVDQIFGSYFKEGTDATLQGILEITGQSEISDYFSWPRTERENAENRLHNIAVEQPNELYASFNIHLALTERRLRPLGLLVIPILLGSLGAVLSVSFGVLREEHRHIYSYSRIWHLLLRITFGGGAGIASGSFLPNAVKGTYGGDYLFAFAFTAGFLISFIPSLAKSIEKHWKSPSQGDNS